MRFVKRGWVYFLGCLVAFYLLFLIGKSLGSEMVLMLLALPCFTFIVSVIYGISNGFDFTLPVAVSVAFFPALFYVFSLDYAAWGIYAVIFAVISIAGCYGGHIFYKKRNSQN